MAPLKSEQSEHPPCNIRGKIESKVAAMVVDSGCTRTLVHKRFVKNSFLTGDKISVLNATGERLLVSLAWVVIESAQGKHKELLGVLDRLSVDCLLGRSSFGQTLSRENILEQWEQKISGYNPKGTEDFVLTRHQKAKQDAQQRKDALIDRENSLAVKSLSKKEPKRDGLEQGNLQELFGDNATEEPDETSENNSDSNMKDDAPKEELPINILDRNRNQLSEDQMSDVTIDKVRTGGLRKYQKTPTVIFYKMEF